MVTKLTPAGSQTVGPFFRIGLEHLCAQDAVEAPAAIDCITVSGSVLDGAAAPVPDALIEIWHAGRDGGFNTSAETSGRSSSFTRAATDERGVFRFSIPRPGRSMSYAADAQAPHIAVLVFARGLLRHLLTRMYFPDEPANAEDPVLQSIPIARRHTLIARPDAKDATVFTWNVILQGEEETVFFAW
jgi:protocatechuate 3,4-dioxygenase, alpha subunit